MDIEVLVHIKAPARRVDDRKYASIAQSVMHFTPAEITHITSHSPDDGLVHTSHEKPDLQQPTHGVIISAAGYGNPLSSSGIKQSATTRPRNAVVKVHTSQNRYRWANSRLTTQQTSVRSKASNPPYRSPLRARLSRNTGAECSISTNTSKTPLQRARDAKVLVPNTKSQGRNKFLSSSFYSNEEYEFVQNSQPFSSDKITADTTPCHPEADPRPDSQKRKGQANNLPQLPREARRCKTNESVETTTEVANCLHLTCHSSSLIVGEGNIQTGAHHCVETDVEPPCARCSERVAHEKLVVTSGEESTLTASSCTQLSPVHVADGNESLQATMNASLVDLVTPEAVICSIETSSRRRCETLPCGSSSGMSEAPDSSESTPCLSIFASVQSLPLVINPPSTSLVTLNVPSYKTPILQATAEGLAMPKCFRPKLIVRNIMDKERGYWLVPITLVSSQKERDSAGRFRMTSKDNDYLVSRPLLKYKDLTEQEFCAVWEELTRFISSGSAGWSTRLVRRKFSICRNRKSGNHNARLHLQVYCYGEAIPYIYAMLLVCTRMHILCKPLQWISTLDEKPVLMMCGEELRSENLRP